MQAEDLTEEEETVVEERRRNMVTVRSAHKVTFFILLMHGIVCQLNDGIPDSKYQGYLGPQGALDSPSGSHRAHWKFRKVIKVEISTLITISSSSKPNLLILKGDKRRHTMNVDLEACEEDQDTLKGVFKHFERVTKLLCIGATLISN